MNETFFTTILVYQERIENKNSHRIMYSLLQGPVENFIILFSIASQTLSLVGREAFG